MTESSGPAPGTAQERERKACPTCLSPDPEYHPVPKPEPPLRSALTTDGRVWWRKPWFCPDPFHAALAPPSGPQAAEGEGEAPKRAGRPHATWGDDPSGYCGCDDCNAPDPNGDDPAPSAEMPGDAVLERLRVAWTTCPHCVGFCETCTRAALEGR